MTHPINWAVFHRTIHDADAPDELSTVPHSATFQSGVSAEKNPQPGRRLRLSTSCCGVAGNGFRDPRGQWRPAPSYGTILTASSALFCRYGTPCVIHFGAGAPFR